MSAHVRGVLTVQYMFTDYCAIQILIEVIVYEVSWDGRNAKYFLMPVDISGFFNLLAWYMLSRVEDRLNFRICGIYCSNMGANGIVHHDHL